jgi:hypothetical protein
LGVFRRTERDGTWYLIRADNPIDAFSHQRQSLAEVADHMTTGHCVCPVETVGQGTWKQVMRMAAAADAEVTARPVPDFRVSISRMPRCNEITGPGQWTIPVECW